jgi:hypothetical protein
MIEYRNLPVVVKGMQITVNTPIRIHLLWDIHYGANGMNLNLLKKAINQIASGEHDYFVLGGDCIEAIAGIDWRAFRGKYDSVPKEVEVKDLPKLMNIVKKGFIDLFAPIAKKGLIILEGNHEEKWGRFIGYSLLADIAEQLGIPYAGEKMAVLWLKLIDKQFPRKTWEYPILLHHGFGGGILPGGKVNRQRQWADEFEEIRASVRSHTHDIVIVRTAKTGFRRKRATKEMPYGGIKPYITSRLDIMAGGFRGDALYARDSGYRYSPSGWVVLQIIPRRATNDHLDTRYVEDMAYAVTV